jgi:predicted dehydrogenase
MGPEPGRGNALTIAVLGQGSIGRRHAANLLALGCEVMVFDPVAAEVAEGATRVETAEAALEAAQAAVVASPTSEHLGQVRAALEHGCHVLSE